jgi:putative hemolysin
LRNAVNALFGPKLPPPVQGALHRMLLLDRVNELFEQVHKTSGSGSFCARMLDCLHVEPRVSSLDLSRIPKQGPVVAVANHPFGVIEGTILAALLPTIRPDVKIMTSYLLAEFPELHQLCIFVDPFGGDESIQNNQKGLRESLQWLRRGGLLVIFPAGEVAHLDLKQRQITDPPWNVNAARIARKTGSTVLPIYFHGANSALFHILGLVHPRLRTALLPHEFLNKQHAGIELRIGNPIPPRKFEAFPDDEALIRHMRHRTYLLQGRQSKRRSLAPPFLRGRTHQTALAEVIPPVGPEALKAEIGGLSADHFLAESGELTAVLARAGEIPQALREIGRLRELTFRLTGEGTGKSIDLDSFDSHYLHLFLWNKDAGEIAGAYRLGPTDRLVSRFGKKGLYTDTLFAYKTAFLNRIDPALEMGRSFVRPEYQKSYAPLLLLWKGIGQYVVQNPKYKVLFGPVSISNEYNPASRQLMVTFLKTYTRSDDLAKLVRARSPFRIRPIRALEGIGEELHSTAVWDIEELSALIADIETDQKGVPILLKQYLKLGGKLVAFNVDPHFANTLDGLIVVDLAKTDPRVLDRYMGKKGAAAFLDYHQAVRDTRVPA